MPRILLGEDNEMNRDMLSRRLHRRGYTVVCAVDGQQGIEAAGRERPDLILMDMSLPVIDGWEATRRIKGDPAVQGIPSIALTAHAMASDELTETTRALLGDRYVFESRGEIEVKGKGRMATWFLLSRKG